AGESRISGPYADRFNQLRGIFVDKTTSPLYIADLLNRRIQNWPKNALEGVTGASSNGGKLGSNNASLDRPYGLRVDKETKIVYVVNLMNNRIQRWKHDETDGDTIVGGTGMFIISFIFSHQQEEKKKMLELYHRYLIMMNIVLEDVRLKKVLKYF
ncbi:unnamed protein product, partial [Rotaria sordida]